MENVLGIPFGLIAHQSESPFEGEFRQALFRISDRATLAADERDRGVREPGWKVGKADPEWETFVRASGSIGI